MADVLQDAIAMIRLQRAFEIIRGLRLELREAPSSAYHTRIIECLQRENAALRIDNERLRLQARPLAVQLSAAMVRYRRKREWHRIKHDPIMNAARNARRRELRAAKRERTS